MPVTFRLSDLHLNYLASRAREEPKLSGELFIKDMEHGTPKWQKRWTVLYQNFLFYFENSSCAKPVGMIFLEHSTTDVVSLTKLRDLSNQVNTAKKFVHKGWTLNQFVFLFHTYYEIDRIQVQQTRWIPLCLTNGAEFACGSDAVSCVRYPSCVYIYIFCLFSFLLSCYIYE